MNCCLSSLSFTDPSNCRVADSDESQRGGLNEVGCSFEPVEATVLLPPYRQKENEMGRQECLPHLHICFTKGVICHFAAWSRLVRD